MIDVVSAELAHRIVVGARVHYVESRIVRMAWSSVCDNEAIRVSARTGPTASWVRLKVSKRFWCENIVGIPPEDGRRRRQL